MKREVRLLKDRAVSSLVLAVEFFNRPWDQGRTEAVLILLDHSFEMLLKASIVHKGGKIREKGDKNTIGFDSCVRKSVTDGDVKFLNEEQALTLQTINGLRDAAQHYILDLSEGQLYMHAQSGLTLFRDICFKVFDEDVSKDLPDRVLPLSVSAPTDIATLFDREVEEVRSLLKPGKRKKLEARAKLRALAIFEGAIAGERYQPSKSDLEKFCFRVSSGEKWNDLFPGVASINYSLEGEGPYISLRFTKKDGIPIHVVPEGVEDGFPVAIKRVNELGYYSLGIQQIAEKLNVSWVKLRALVDIYDIQNNEEYFKLIRIQKSEHPRYSQKALIRMQEILEERDIDYIWNEHKERKKAK